VTDRARTAQTSTSVEDGRVISSEDADPAHGRDSEPPKLARTFPTDEALAAFLATILENGTHANGVRLLGRDRSRGFSTMTNEVVHGKLSDGTEFRLLCKYGPANAHPGFGHRRGLEYEIRIYRELLSRLALSTPHFWGSRFDAASGQHWLAIEYVPGGLTVNKGPQPATLIAAAQWVADFHAQGLALVADRPSSDFIEYDASYFEGWGLRMREFAEPLLQSYPWLGKLCDGYTQLVPRMLLLPRTLIHGEYTPQNVLLRNSTAVSYKPTEAVSLPGGVPLAPVDWESAAISFGEIDLAFLLDGKWSEALQQTCIAEYKHRRYGTDVPKDFDDRYRMAQLYTHLRWLGDRSSWTTLKTVSWRFDRLQSLGRHFDIL
jgi:aminoglycoside phosphotransferase (APT) family kinase protein